MIRRLLWILLALLSMAVSGGSADELQVTRADGMTHIADDARVEQWRIGALQFLQPELWCEYFDRKH